MAIQYTINSSFVSIENAFEEARDVMRKVSPLARYVVEKRAMEILSVWKHKLWQDFAPFCGCDEAVSMIHDAMRIHAAILKKSDTHGKVIVHLPTVRYIFIQIVEELLKNEIKKEQLN